MRLSCCRGPRLASPPATLPQRSVILFTRGRLFLVLLTTPTALAGRRSLNYLTVVLEQSAESTAKTSVNATLVPLETAFLQRVGSYPRPFAALVTPAPPPAPVAPCQPCGPS